MDVAKSKTRDKYPLSTRKILKKTLMGVFGWALLALAGVGFLTALKVGMSLDERMASDLGPFLPYMNAVIMGIVILYIILVVIDYLYEKWYFAVYYYELGDNFLAIKKGPITPTEINVPYERFQDVYVDQDIIDRMLGLYDVHISSATVTSGMEAHIDGLLKADASALRDELLEIIRKKVSREHTEAK